MISVKRFNLLVIVLPALYLIHNLEEWFVFAKQVDTIRLMVPAISEENPKELILAFSLGLAFATVLTLLVSLLIWGKPTILNARILFVIALATLINGLSHITSTIVLGFFSPGLITAITLCLPYSIWILMSIKRVLAVSIKGYLVLLLLAIILYAGVILISWFVGFGFNRLFLS